MAFMEQCLMNPVLQRSALCKTAPRQRSGTASHTEICPLQAAPWQGADPVILAGDRHPQAALQFPIFFWGRVGWHRVFCRGLPYGEPLTPPPIPSSTGAQNVIGCKLAFCNVKLNSQTVFAHKHRLRPVRTRARVRAMGLAPKPSRETLSVLFVSLATRRAPDPTFTKIQFNGGRSRGAPFSEVASGSCASASTRNGIGGVRSSHGTEGRHVP
jgi:hypothetical protein